MSSAIINYQFLQRQAGASQQVRSESRGIRWALRVGGASAALNWELVLLKDHPKKLLQDDVVNTAILLPRILSNSPTQGVLDSLLGIHDRCRTQTSVVRPGCLHDSD